MFADRLSPITALTPDERRTARLHHDPRLEAVEYALDLLDTAERLADQIALPARQEVAA